MANRKLVSFLTAFSMMSSVGLNLIQPVYAADTFETAAVTKGIDLVYDSENSTSTEKKVKMYYAGVDGLYGAAISVTFDTTEVTDATFTSAWSSGASITPNVSELSNRRYSMSMTVTTDDPLTSTDKFFGTLTLKVSDTTPSFDVTVDTTSSLADPNETIVYCDAASVTVEGAAEPTPTAKSDIPAGAIIVKDQPSVDNRTTEVKTDTNNNKRAVAYSTVNNSIWYLGQYDVSEIASIDMRLGLVGKYSEGELTEKPQVKLAYMPLSEVEIDSTYLTTNSSTIRSSNNILAVVDGVTEPTADKTKGHEYTGALFTVTDSAVTVDSTGYAAYPGGTVTLGTCTPLNTTKTTGKVDLFIYATAQGKRATMDYVVINLKEEATATPTAAATVAPTATPTARPTATPTAAPTATPTAEPTATPTATPIVGTRPSPEATTAPTEEAAPTATAFPSETIIPMKDTIDGDVPATYSDGSNTYSLVGVSVDAGNAVYGKDYVAEFDGDELTEDEFNNLINGYTNNSVSDVIDKTVFKTKSDVTFATSPMYLLDESDSDEVVVLPGYAVPVTAAEPAPTSTPTARPTTRPSGGSGTRIGGGSSTSIATPSVNTSSNGGVVSTNAGFIDLDTVPWAVTAINALASYGILNGRSDTIFDPLAPVTRAEFAKMVCNTFNVAPITPSKQTFTDVAPSDWFYSYVEAAASVGIVNGVSDTEFDPNAIITREQMAAMMYRAINVTGSVLKSGSAVKFNDAAKISEYAVPAVNALSAAGVINGKDNNIFAPQDTATRAEAACVIYQYYVSVVSG